MKFMLKFKAPFVLNFSFFFLNFRLKMKGTGGAIGGQAVPNANINELKSFSGAQVLNVGSILLRPSGTSSGGGSGLITRSRRNSTRPTPASASSPQAADTVVLNRPSKIVTIDKSANAGSEETKKLIVKKKKKPKSSAETASKAAKKPSSTLTLNNDKTEEEDDDEDEEDDDEEEEDEDEEEDDDEEDDDEDDDEDEDCDNCFTRTKFGNILYKFVYKPVVRPIKFIYYSIRENLKLFRLFKFCLFALCNFILSFFYEAPFYFINSYMVETGSTTNQAGTITVAVGIVSVFSSSMQIGST